MRKVYRRDKNYIDCDCDKWCFDCDLEAVHMSRDVGMMKPLLLCDCTCHL